MALTPDYINKKIISDASITDIVAFHGLLRDIEKSDAGVLSPVIHSYKQVDLGGGAIFPAVAFINGWTLQFPAGNFEIKGGNLAANINPVANCYVRITQAAAYAVTAVGSDGGGSTLTAEDVRVEMDNRSTKLATIQAAVVDLPNNMAAALWEYDGDA